LIKLIGLTVSAEETLVGGPWIESKNKPLKFCHKSLIFLLLQIYFSVVKQAQICTTQNI
jgi:hypothetical protein